MTRLFVTTALLAVFSILTPVLAADAKKAPAAELGAVDKNKDGVVSKEEADAVAASQFAGFDADKNGKITQEEFNSEIFKVNKAPPPADQKAKVEKMLSERFKSQDMDKDGSITKAEYMEDSTKRHKAMDLNGDGKVTKGELADLRAKITAQMKKQLEAQKKAAGQ